MVINWNAVATAGVTAIVVTALVEYLAKPGLDARKERILDLERARRQLLAAVARASLAARKVGTRLPEDADPDLQKIWAAEANRHYEVMRAQVEHMSDDLDRYALSYTGDLQSLLTAYVFCAHAIVLSLRTRERQADLIAKLGVPVATVLERPRPWQIAAWFEAQQTVKRMIADIEAEADKPKAH